MGARKHRFYYIAHPVCGLETDFRSITNGQDLKKLNKLNKLKKASSDRNTFLQVRFSSGRSKTGGIFLQVVKVGRLYLSSGRFGLFFRSSDFLQVAAAFFRWD